MTPRTAPSQRDIAARAGVSQSAVSIVLNGRSEEMGISRSTQERIKCVIEELQYVPNIAARALRKSRNDLIGVYTFERVFPVHSNDYYNEFLQGIEEGAIALGLDLVLFTSSLEAGNGAGVYDSGSNRLGIADGTVMLGSRKSDEELARLAQEGYPFVFIGRRDVPGVTVPCVTADYYSVMSSVLEVLTTAGHERILYVGRRERLQPEVQRLEGYRDFARLLGATASIQLTDPDEITGESVRIWVAQGWTAIVAETSDIATTILDTARATNIAIPEELSLVALDVGVSSDQGDVSQVGVPRRAMGREAVSLLAKIIHDGTVQDRTVEFQCSPPTAATVAAPKIGSRYFH